MLCVDVEEVLSGKLNCGLFGSKWFNPIRFVEKDYVKSEPGSLRQRIENKVSDLGGNWQSGRIAMLVQARCFGLYFSPANFYFCYQDDADGKIAGSAENEVCRYMLAEVSNTPWNQRHYYLVDLQKPQISDKEFHVSPFMDLDMSYHWKVKAPLQAKNNLLVNIENHSNNDLDDTKLFDATLAMTKQPFTKKSLFRVWATLPMMTFKIVLGIYYQAMRLFIKRVPFISYKSGTDKKSD